MQNKISSSSFIFEVFSGKAETDEPCPRGPVPRENFFAPRQKAGERS